MKPAGLSNDPIPPRLFKDIIFNPVLKINNASVASGIVPASFKHAVVTPLNKKPGSDNL